VLRPDGHVAAVLTRSADVAAAVARLLARQGPPCPPPLVAGPRPPHPSQARGGPLQGGRPW
jgi:pentachlorophenol monooxygenase/3-(3-hydroxy-phenyl)propionate hydroxylase